MGRSGARAARRSRRYEGRREAALWPPIPRRRSHEQREKDGQQPRGTAEDSRRPVSGRRLFLSGTARPAGAGPARKNRVQLFPSINNDIRILRIVLHAESVSAILLRCHDRCAGPSEQVEDILSRLAGALHLVIKQLNRLHGRMLRRLDRLIEIQHSCLPAVLEEVVLLAFRPSV